MFISGLKLSVCEDYHKNNGDDRKYVHVVILGLEVAKMFVWLLYLKNIKAHPMTGCMSIYMCMSVVGRFLQEVIN